MNKVILTVCSLLFSGSLFAQVLPLVNATVTFNNPTVNYCDMAVYMDFYKINEESDLPIPDPYVFEPYTPENPHRQIIPFGFFEKVEYNNTSYKCEILETETPYAICDWSECSPEELRWDCQNVGDNTIKQIRFKAVKEDAIK